MEIAQLILEIIIILLGLYMAFFKSYFSEHGKQLALKDHIEELTRKVENVKSEIDFLTKTKFDLATNERSAIIDYHSNYYDWRNTVLNLYPSVINEDNFDSKDQFINESRTKELLTKNSEERLSLFQTSEQPNKSKTEMVIACMKLQHHAAKYFSLVAKEYLNLHYTKKAKPVEEHLEITKEHYQNIEELLDKFMSEKIQLFKELKAIENEVNAQLKYQLFKEVS